MEAFIIADRVLTAEHMQPRSHSQPRYLKRYDRSPASLAAPTTAQPRQRKFKIRHEPSPITSTTKNLLKALCQKKVEVPPTQ